MTMTAKTMEFDTLVVRYDYGTRALSVQVKGDGENHVPVAVVRGEPEQKGAIVLNNRGISELREALEGIGQQVSSGRRPS